MDDKTHRYYLEDLGKLLIEQAFETQKRAIKSKQPFDQGQVMSYYSVISLMQSQAIAFGIPLAEIGLEGVSPDKDLVCSAATDVNANDQSTGSRSQHDSPASYTWTICLLALLFGLLAYVCTRGKDGRLLLALSGLGLLTSIYVSLIRRLGRFTISSFVIHLLLFEAFTIAALLINPQLDEMGGMLDALFPLAVLGAVILGLLLRVRRPKEGPR